MGEEGSRYIGTIGWGGDSKAIGTIGCGGGPKATVTIRLGGAPKATGTLTLVGGPNAYGLLHGAATIMCNQSHAVGPELELRSELGVGTTATSAYASDLVR